MQETSAVNNSSLWRKTAALYGGIKRLMDLGHLTCMTRLEKQITVFMSSPSLVAWPAVTKAWKKQKERQASDSRMEPKVISSAIQILNLHGKKEWQEHVLQPPLTTLFLSFHKSVRSTEHALMTTNINMNSPIQTTRLLVQHLFGLDKRQWNIEVIHFQVHHDHKEKKSHILAWICILYHVSWKLLPLTFNNAWEKKKQTFNRTTNRQFILHSLKSFYKSTKRNYNTTSTSVPSLALPKQSWQKGCVALYLFLCKTPLFQVCCQGRWGFGEAARCNSEMLSAPPALCILKIVSK